MPVKILLLLVFLITMVFFIGLKLIYIYKIVINKNLENFTNSDKLNQILGDNEQYKLKKLIQTKSSDQFGDLVWDNFSFLGSVPKCSQFDFRNNCPISIYEPYLENGYLSIGQIITKSHNNPRFENVLDPRQPKISEIDNTTNLKAITVFGNSLKHPLDFKKVISFGNGSMSNRLENRETLRKIEKKINFKDYYPALIEVFSKYDMENGQIISQQMEQLKKYFMERVKINAIYTVKDGQTLTNLQQYGRYYKDNDFPYKLYNLELGKYIDDFNILKNINNNMLSKNQNILNIYTIDERKEIVKKLRINGFLTGVPENNNDLKNIMEKHFKNRFYLIECPKGFQCQINHQTSQSIIGLVDSKDYFITGNLGFKSMTYRIHPDYFKYMLDTRFKTLNDLVNKAKVIDEKEKIGQYYMITIWQPQAPDGYVALGYIATNSEEKPKNTSIVCLPKNCVKAFNRRKWIPDDKVWEVIINNVKYSFWRNPYLGTIIVSVGDKLPDQIPVSNNQSQWLCYDIIPCIKECDYVDKLIDSEKKSKNLCKAHKKINGGYGIQNNYNQSDWEETKQLQDLVNERKTYLKDLVERIKKILREEELYQELTKSHNRFHFKNTVEEQRLLHDKLVDKLLNEKGIKVDIVSPEGLSKLKKLLNILVNKESSTPETPICDDCPMCPAPDMEGLVKLKDLSGCYGCIEHVVAELIGDLASSGQEIPTELKQFV